jgi:hypothetical protein
MADGKVEGNDLKKLLLLGKRMPLAFAFCPGPKDDHALLIDKKKKPKVLSTTAKKVGAGVKVAFGTLVLNEKTVELTCEKTLPKMAKVLKKYFKSQRLIYDVVIMDIDGEVIESDRDAAAEETPPQRQETPPQNVESAPEETAPDPKETADLVERIKAFLPAIAAASEANSDRLDKAKSRAIAQIKAGDLQGAERTIAAIEVAIAKQQQHATAAPDPTSTPEAEPQEQAPSAQLDAVNALREKVKGIAGPAGEKLSDALAQVTAFLDANKLKAADVLIARITQAVEKRTGTTDPTDQPQKAANWAGAETKLQDAIAKLMQTGSGDLGAIKQAFDFARTQAAAGNYDKAMSAVALTAGLIKKARADATEKTASDPFAKSRQAWIDTRAGMLRDLEGLQSAIDKATRDEQGLEEVQTKSSVLFDYLDGLDSTLETTLGRLSEVSDSGQSDGLKSAAHKIIDQYRGVLDTDFFMAVDKNGFVDTNIRATALNALQEVSAVLDA